MLPLPIRSVAGLPITAAIMGVLVVTSLGAPGTLRAAEPPAPAATRAGHDFFEKKIRPVLVAQCQSCHSEADKKRKGGLTLDTAAGLVKGGNNGPAFVAGSPEKSLLIRAIRGGDKDVQVMPPKGQGTLLTDAQVRDFEHWIRIGAPDPRGKAGPVRPTKEDAARDAKNWWAFQPVSRPAGPVVRDTAWPVTDIDRHVLAGLEAKGIRPAADADAHTVLRRLYFDLVGLPPAGAEIDAFVKAYAADPQSAVEKLVDRLLAMPEFGQRWGRHWLDVARYAESSGRDVNVAYPHAWRYRDYVIDAMNADLPYDQFLREQIAGDLMPARDDKTRARRQIATGFLAVGSHSLNEQNPRQFAVDVADEMIDTVSQAVLGVTVACARCHDHKFDPISQREYTAMAGIFLSTEVKYGTPGAVGGRNAGTLVTLPKGAEVPIVAKGMTAAERKSKQERLDALQAELNDALKDRLAGGKDSKKKAGNDGFNIVRIVTQAAQLRAELSSVAEDGSPLPLAMGVADKPAGRAGGPGFGFGKGAVMKAGPGGFRRPSGFDSIGDSPLFGRGEIDKPGERVPRGLPSALVQGRAPSIPASSSGRLELAQWLTSAENPLTSRVMANRIWHWMLGRGVVESVDNFGTTGDRPANPALLDHLAVKFVDGGWSVKALVRSIAVSRTYRLAAVRTESLVAADPGNALFGRGNYRRLDAESIRDAMLAAAGLLDTKAHPGSMVARAGDGPIGGPRFQGLTEERVVDADGDFRSVYLPVPRSVLPETLAVFDFPDAASVNGSREATNVPTQALYLLNGDFPQRVSKATAERILKAHPGRGADASFDARIDMAYRAVLSRPPEAAEKTAARDFLRRMTAVGSAPPAPAEEPKGFRKFFVPRTAPAAQDTSVAAWTSLCRALFSTAEFRHVR